MKIKANKIPLRMGTWQEAASHPVVVIVDS